jgi:hypothetical protein
MGRPKKSPEDLRDDPLHVMMTQRERAELEHRASLYGMTVSEFVRSRTLGWRMPPLAPERRDRAALTTALLRLGVNLNQIAHHMNAGRSAPPILPALIGDIRAHIDRLHDEPGRDRHG